MWCVVSFTPRPRLPQGKRLPVPIVQEAGWAPELVWTQTLQEKSFVSPANRTMVVQSVIRQYTELYRLRNTAIIMAIKV
jgi:hypothetical protein